MLAMWPGLAAGGPVRAYLWAFFATVCYAAVLTINRLLRHETGAAVLILWSSLPGLILVVALRGDVLGGALAARPRGAGGERAAGGRGDAVPRHRLPP